MFQLNGWAEILTTTTGDENSAKLDELVISLKGRIASLTLGD
jgi:hypothetical protein